MRSRIQPIRLLTAVPICDGHDSAITTINEELIRHGVEVIYLGYHRSARDIARAAVQEDVRAIGISSYNGGHVEFFSEVADHLCVWSGRRRNLWWRRRDDHSRRRESDATPWRRSNFLSRHAAS